MTEATPQGAMDLHEAAAALENKFNEAPVTEEPLEEVTQEAEEVEASDVTESEDAEVEASDDEETIEQEQPEEDAETVELEPEEFAKILGLEGNDISVDDDGTVKLKVKIDGEESSVTLNDLRKSYQLEGHVNRKSMELAEQRKAFEEEAEAAKQQYAQTLNQAGAMVQHLEQELLGQFQAINWAELEQTDPGRYAAERQKFGEKYQQVEQIKNQVVTEAQQMQAKQEQEQKQAYQELQAKEAKILADKLGWTTPEKWEQASGQLHTYLVDSGFSNSEIAEAADHRLLVMAEKARQFDALQKGGKLVEKKVKKAPKLTKPGAKVNKRDQVRQKQAELKKRAIRSGRTEDLAKALMDRI
jgi:hypothetical protein